MRSPTLHHIRHFDPQVQYVHPDALKARGRHFLAARVLNAARFALETLAQYALLEGLLQDQERDTPLPVANKWATRFRFWRDVVEEEARYREASPFAKPVESPPVPVARSAESYRAGRVEEVKVQTPIPEATTVTPPPPGVPKPLDKMVERYGQPPRQRRYALSGQTVVLEDEEFEAMPPPADPERAKALIAEQQRTRSLLAAAKPTPPPPPAAKPPPVPSPSGGLPPLPGFPSLPPLPGIPRVPNGR